MTSHTATAELGCLDGEIGPAEETFIPATDEGLLRGDGVFEVVRVYDGRPFALPDHLDRIERSAANLALGWEVPRNDLEAEVPQILGERGAGFDGLVRIVLTRGGRRLPVPPGPERPRLGFVTYAPTRVLDGVKSLSYAANMLCTRRARERGFDEALLVTPHGRVLEAPTASVFWAGADGVLSTPPLDEHILASITRDRVLRLVEVREAPLTREELLEAEEVFLCSTTREVQAAAAVEDHELGEPGPRTREARDALREHIQAELAS
jgi:branched-subunit amino acid aminotransferase/4-amino-4-deoxychorismate lyase